MEISDKERLQALSLYLGICIGFMSKCDVLDMFKASHPEVLKGIDKYIYLKDKKKD